MGAITIPGGPEQGTPVRRASAESLRWWARNGLVEEIRNACGAELARRAAPGNGPPTQRSSQADAGLVTGDIGGWLQRLSEAAILIAPTNAGATLPSSFSVAWSLIHVSVRRDCYLEKGDPANPDPLDELGIHSPLLQRIALAAGLTWIRESTCRTDDGSDPHRCSYSAWCRTLDFDGQNREHPGEAEIDLRDGSERANTLLELPDGRRELARARDYIRRTTLTAAMNAAIRKALGVEHTYPRTLLEGKPFAVVKLQHTVGRTESRKATAVLYGEDNGRF